jgi:hypothetical protein
MNISQGFGCTPSSNTGSINKFSSRLDWLQGTVNLFPTRFERLLGELTEIFIDTFAPDAGYWFSGRSFDHHRVSDRGARVAWNILENGYIDAWFMLPAKFLSGCDRTDTLIHFIAILNQISFKPTRIDLAIDDFTKSLTWQHFDSAYDAGHAHGFRECGLSTSKKERQQNGFTFYMGSKRSEKLYRFYDKSKESNGEIDAFRLEAQFRDEWSRSVWSILSAAKNSKQLHRAIVNSVCSPINFYQESVIEGTNILERTYLDWWEDFKKLVQAEGITLCCGRVKTSIESTMQWVEEQVETSLAMIENYLDRTSGSFFDWFMARLENGRKRLTSIHVNKVESAYLNWTPPVDVCF